MDDVSAIPNTGCNVLTSSTTLSNYNGRTKLDYIANGGKWYKYRTQTSTYNDYDISSYTCIDVSKLNSYAYMTSIYYSIGFLLFIVTISMFFKTIKGVLYAN